MMDKVNQTAVAVDIEKNTRLGSAELQACNVKKALEYFDLAYKNAHKAKDDSMLRACAFNLGAVHIADHNPQKGIHYLKKAIPVTDVHDGHSNGDLYYNFGLAYESMDNKQEAVKYFELSQEDYQKDKDTTMEAEVAAKIGGVYLSLGQFLQSARAYGVASASYSAIPDQLHQAQYLSQQAAALLKANKMEDTMHIADDCMIVCQTVTQNETLGKIYNELGLLYTQCTDYDHAQTCFELALPLSRSPRGDKRQQAVILQNLGAVYNSLGDYQRSLGFHESAAALHSELHNRNAQGQSFTNLAYAYSRLGDTEGAGECYLHALQAAKDTSDEHGQWQAMEGLGAVSFHEGNIQRAKRYYQMALSTLSGSGEHNAVAQDRLIMKLRDVLQHDLTQDSPLPNMGSPIPININDLPRPPTRQEMQDLEKLREIRKERMLELKKIPYQFDRIALGLGDYDTDSDFTVPKHRQHRPRPPSVTSDEVDHDSPWGRRDGRRSGRDSRLSMRSRDGRENRFEHRRDSLPNGNVSGKKPPVKRLSRRHSTKKIEESSRRQAYLSSLLRPEGYDSEEEWRQRVKKKKGSIGTADRYRPRVRPASAEGDNEVPIVKHDLRRQRTQAARRQQSKSDTELDPAALERLHIEEQQKRRSQLASIPVERSRSRRATDSTETDQDGFAGDERISTPGGERDHSGDRAHWYAAEQEGDEATTDSEESRDQGSEVSTEGDTIEDLSETESESRSLDGLNDTDANLNQYHQRMKSLDQEGDQEMEDESQTDSGSDTAVETETEAPLTDTLGPPDYTAPVPSTAQRPLHGTYEKPVDDEPSTSTHDPSELKRRRSRNYFRETTLADDSIVQGRGHGSVGEGEGRGTVGEGQGHDPSVANIKRSVPNPDDPTYQTIQSLLRPEPPEGSAGLSEEGPPLPPRPINQMTVGEQEEFLKQYRQQQLENSRDSVGRPPVGEDVKVPVRNKGHVKSKACVVM